MKRIILFIALAIPVRGWAQGDETQFDRLKGEWAGSLGGGSLYEKWQKDKEGYSGNGYFIAGMDTVVSEQLFIRKFGAHWVYVAIINDGKPVMFTLKEAEESRLIFENKGHDFPQRIIYDLSKADELNARIEGFNEGKESVEEYHLVKKK